jgi:hypothetical protein
MSERPDLIIVWPHLVPSAPLDTEIGPKAVVHTDRKVEAQLRIEYTFLRLDEEPVEKII